MPEVRADVIIAAPAGRVWAVVVDWPRQAEWILGTRVEVAAGDGASVGSRIEAFTGLGQVGFLDTMTITAWDPPRRCDVVHTGAVVRGTGSFLVQPLPAGRSRFLWTETLDLPAGAVGSVGWRIVGPAAIAGVRRSLRRLAELVEADSSVG